MKLRTVIFLPCMFFASAAVAEGVSVNPGKWEMTMTMQMSMLPTPQVRTTTECVEQDELSPDDFDMGEDSPCNVSDVEIDGNQVSWAINCPGPAGGDMSGNWSFTSEGDSISGQGSMAAEMAGQKMDFRMEWSGRRVGECESGTRD